MGVSPLKQLEIGVQTLHICEPNRSKQSLFLSLDKISSFLHNTSAPQTARKSLTVCGFCFFSRLADWVDRMLWSWPQGLNR
jgi:hypothetical protein